MGAVASLTVSRLSLSRKLSFFSLNFNKYVIARDPIWIPGSRMICGNFHDILKTSTRKNLHTSKVDDWLLDEMPTTYSWSLQASFKGKVASGSCISR